MNKNRLRLVTDKNSNILSGIY